MKSDLVFMVHRREPILIAPARPTPRELKKLSDIDDQEALRFQIPIMQFYRCDRWMEGKDPVRVIREAVEQALVFYYPLAGRLREGRGRKLSVDCTGEGVLFIEADADVELVNFGDPPEPPFPCFEDLLFDVPGSGEILINTPLLLIQVTRLKCSGFIFGIRINHTISDGFGMTQFLDATSQIARGAHVPTISPVWSREHFYARDPPHVTCTHIEYDKDTSLDPPFHHHNDLVDRYFFFGSSEISAIRRFVPKHMIDKCTTFEILTACLWRCRTRALGFDSEDEVRLYFSVNARGKLQLHPPVPIGYYGNALVIPAAATTAGRLSSGPLEYALQLLRSVKENVTEEYIKSTVDLLVIKGRPHFAMVRPFLVSDVTRVGFDETDFGWGKPAFGGVVTTEEGLSSYYMRFRNGRGEVGRLVSIGLPALAMDKFVIELGHMLGH